MTFHNELTAPYLHSPFNWVYADSVARLAATGFVAADVSNKKLALQIDDFSQWVLTNHSPITWAQTGGGAIVNGSITLAKLADMATASVYYRRTAGTGSPEVQTLAQLKTDLGLANNNNGDQTISITGEVTANGSTGVLTASIDKTAITNKNLVAVATDDKILFSDTSNSGALAYTTPGAIAALASSASVWPVRRFFAKDFEDPNNSSWASNFLANIDQDPVYTSAKVRAFDDTLNEGVGFFCYIPASAVNLILKFRGRARTAPATTKKVEMGLYFRGFPDNAAITTWSAVTNIRVIDIAVNAYPQYDSYTETLSNLSLTADMLYHFELIRKANDSTNGTLVGDYLLYNLEVTFS